MSMVFITMGCAPASTDITGTIRVPQRPSAADDHTNAKNDMLILKKQDNGKSITVKLGDIIQVELERSSGAGYEWHLDKTYKEHFVLVKEEREELIRDHLVGTPVIVRWQLKAVQQGNIELILLLYRNWEGKEKAASSFQLGVKIL